MAGRAGEFDEFPRPGECLMQPNENEVSYQEPVLVELGDAVEIAPEGGLELPGVSGATCW
jgi:hypothetical protein